MVEKTAGSSDSQDKTDKPTAPGSKTDQPPPPAKEAQGSSGFDPVDGAGQRDGQKGRPEARAPGQRLRPT